MRILIKSEMDSRPLLYPLMRCLLNHGSIVVITTNKYLTRLIDNELEGGFRNIRIIFDERGAIDETYKDYGIVEGDFDFEIIDNAGATEYDYLLIPISNRVSETFRDDIEPVLDIPTTAVIRFGKKESTPKEKIKKKKGIVVEHEDTAYTPESKWQQRTADEVIVEKLSGTGTWVPFPTFQDVELLEGQHKFYVMDRSIAVELHNILGLALNVEQRYFIKEVMTKDESSGNITGTDVG